MEFHKKGVVEQLGALIVPLVVVGMVLMIGFLIFDEANTIATDVTEDVTHSNITKTYENASFLECVNEFAMSVTAVYNGTEAANSVLLSSANYTVGENSSIMFVDYAQEGYVAIGPSISMTYVCNPKDATYNASIDVRNATQDIPGWLPIIVITVIGALLIGLVAMFRR